MFPENVLIPSIPVSILRLFSNYEHWYDRRGRLPGQDLILLSYFGRWSSGFKPAILVSPLEFRL